MRIHFLSDLHNEFSPFVLPDTNAHVIVLAGDIDLGIKGVEWAKTLGKPVIYVPGNHEPFRRQVSETLQNLRACAVGSDVHILDKNEIVLNGVRFLGCTLWTDFNLFGEAIADAAMTQAELHINDFNVIQHGEQPLKPQTTRQWHKEAVAWLGQKLSEPYDGKTVVVTHHGPHEKCVHPRYARDILSASFSSNLDQLMGKAELWLFGHTHMSIDTKVNGTRILSNPRGFSWFENGAENAHFIPNMVVSLANTIRIFGEDKPMTNGEIHAMLKAVPISDLEVSKPDGSIVKEKGVPIEDFPAEVYKSLYRLANRTGLQRDRDGKVFIDLPGWREIIWRSDPDT